MADILKFLEEKGIIKADDVRDMMEKERRQNIISKHKYAIFQDKDGRWKTTIEDPTSKNGKKLVARKDKRDLEDYIIDYLGEAPRRNVTIRNLYLPWLQSRKLEAASMGTVKKDAAAWKKYYENDPIVDIPMSQFTCQELKDWAHQKIRENGFFKQQYYNMIVIMNKIWQYAKDSDLIDTNTWKDVTINSKLLKKRPRKSNESQIYFMDEKLKLISYALSEFYKDRRNMGALAIPLLFLTGLRIGEVVALKFEDFEGDEIIIRRSEIADYVIFDDGSYGYGGQKIIDHTKTDAGERSIPCTNGARQIMNLLKEAQEECGYYDEGYLFCPKGKRMKSNGVSQKLYTYCEAVGIPRKSAHKIRKTFISQMIFMGIDLDTVCRVSGHTDINTTFKSYTYSLTKKTDRTEMFQNMTEDISNMIENY